MIAKLINLINKYGIDQEVELEGELNPDEALRQFAMNVDIKKVLDIIKKTNGPGVDEILEELDVDTCEPDFIYFFLKDIIDELNIDVESVFEELKKYGVTAAIYALGLYILLMKAFEGDEEKVASFVKSS